MFKNISFFYFFFSLSAIYGLVSYIYITNIVDTYSYLGYDYYYDLERIQEGIFTFIVFSLLLFLIYKKSDFVFSLSLLFFIFSTIPTIVFYSLSKSLYLPIFGHFMFFIFNFLFSNTKIVFKTKQIPQKHLKTFIYVFYFFGIVLFLLTFKFNFNIRIGINEVYDQRDKYNEAGNILTKYFYSTFANIFCPFLIFYGFQNNKKILSFSAVIFCLYLGLISGLKTTFLNLLFVLFFFLIKTNLNKKMLIFLFTIVVFLFISIQLNIKEPVNIINDLLVRRTMFTNPIITNAFFEVFDDKMMCLKHSVFRSFSGFDGVYPTYEVGSYLFDSKEINANTGFIADGFMNFGIIGMIVYTLLMSLIILYIKSLSIKKEYIGIYCIMIISSIEMEFTVMFLTHGLLFLLISSTYYFEKDV